MTIIKVTYTNLGTTTPDKLTLTVDTSAIDRSQVTLVWPAYNECTGTDEVYKCSLDSPGPGQKNSLSPVFWREAGTTAGDVGDLTATVTVEGDTDTSNDSRSIPVVTSPDREPALRVRAETVSRLPEEGDYSVKSDYAEQYTGKPIPPGGESMVFADLTNYGARSATKVRTVGKLPEGVRFLTGGLGNCDFSADRRTADCVWTKTLIPFVFDPELDKFPSGYRARMPIRVDRDARGPAELTGGEWTVSVVAAADFKLTPDSFLAAGGNAGSVRADQKPGDHVEFRVRIGAPPTGGDSGDPGDSDDPGLPVTGPASATVVGAGAALVALGVLFGYASRRRTT